MELNQLGSPLDRDERNKLNQNWTTIENSFGNVVDTVSKKAYNEVIDASKLNWKEPVDTSTSLPTEASEGDTIMARNTGKVYRNNGTEFKEIQQIDAGPVNEIDARLNTKIDNGLNSVNQELAQTEDKLQLDDWELQNKTRKKQALVTIYDDDGRVEAMTRLLPIAEKHNVPFCSSIIVQEMGWSGDNGSVGKYMTKHDLKELEDHGWEILHHSFEDPLRLGDLPYEEQEFQITEAMRRLNSWDIYPKGMTYPFRSRNADTREIARKYLRYAASGGDGINVPPFESYMLRTYTIDDRSLDSLKSFVDEALENNGWLILGTHSFSVAEGRLTELDELISYIKSLGIEIVTFSDALNRMGNIVDTGDYWKDEINPHFVIGSDGNVSSPSIIDVMLPDGSVDGSEYPNMFEPGKISYARMRSDNTANVPEDTGGLLMTNYVVKNIEYVFQIFRVNRTKNIYIREAGIDNRWGDWALLQSDEPVVKLEADSVTAEDDIFTFPRGKISYCEISGGHAGNFPSSGTLMTNRTSVNTSRFYQELHATESWDTYKRWWGAGQESWSVWYKYLME